MTAFNPEINFIGAAVDVSRQILIGQTPPERRGYIAAVMALSSGASEGYRYWLTNVAYDELTADDTAPLHQPPLPGDLSQTIMAYQNLKLQHGIERVTEVDTVLLAAAVDYGNRPVFDTVAHTAHHTSTHPREFGLEAPDRGGPGRMFGTVPTTGELSEATLRDYVNRLALSWGVANG